jgi:2-polyprenyl-3-methyl-5-hydroxy-6-metoxy-1,4-benzoquinol methylase
MPSDVRKAIEKENPWYVQEQLTSVENPHQKKIIKQRWAFFTKIIEQQKTRRPGVVLQVLDAGCGDGVNLMFLKSIPGLRLFACDYNPLRTERASRHFPETGVSQQDLRRIGLSDEAFDVILCSQVLEHIDEDVRALTDLSRVLRPEGRLIAGTPNEGCLMARLRNHVVEPHISKSTDHIHFYVEKELLAKFAEAGLSVEYTMRQAFFFPKQSLNNYFASRKWGFHAMHFLGNIFPSQAGGYYFSLKKNTYGSAVWSGKRRL